MTYTDEEKHHEDLMNTGVLISIGSLLRKCEAKSREDSENARSIIFEACNQLRAIVGEEDE